MKNHFAKTITNKLATAAILGCSCCSSMILGQQLTPASVAKPSSLPPIVRAADMLPTDGVPKITMPTDAKSLPPVVPVANVKLPEATRVELDLTGPIPPITTLSRMPAVSPNPVLGKNFPTNASDQIAEFMRSNTPHEVENTAFLNAENPEANQPSMAILPMADAWQQEGSPSDLQTNPVSREVIATPGLVTPFDPQTGINNETWLPNQTYPTPHQQAQDLSNLPTPISSAGNQGYFEQQPVDDSSGEYADSTWSPATIDYGSSGDTFACCGFVSDASGYAIVDGLYWGREDGTFRAGNFTTVNDYDWTWGGRFTIGKRIDCTRGWEASYMQVDPWLAVNSQNNAAGQLIGAIFPSAGGLPVSAFSAFRNSTFLEQFHKSDLNGAEINKTYWGSDVAKAFIGARYLYFDDEFHLSSANIFGQQGIHTIDTTNKMFGLHVGGELLYDIGYRLAFSVSGKLGGYANFYQGRTGLLNNNTIHVNASRTDTDFSASGDLGVFARLKLGPRTRLRAGYEAMALFNVFDVESNFSTTVLPAAGQNYNDGSAFFHGATLGFEVFR